MKSCVVISRLVNKCMPAHSNANANVSLESNANANANAIFQERIQMRMQMPFSRNACKCFGVAFKCKCFGYTFTNAFELISDVLALY